MKIKFLSLFLLTILVGLLQAQNEITSENEINKNSVYLELGGNSGNLVYFDFLGLDIQTMYTFNYERMFAIKEKTNIAVRLGAGFYKQEWQYYSIPLELTFLCGSKIHHFETGIGTTYMVEINSSNSKQDFFVFFGRIGYRYIGKKGFLFRIGFTPAVDPGRVTFTNSFPINPYGGISIGYNF